LLTAVVICFWPELAERFGAGDVIAIFTVAALLGGVHGWFRFSEREQGEGQSEAAGAEADETGGTFRIKSIQDEMNTIFGKWTKCDILPIPLAPLPIRNQKIN
jgi:hypothetical protein